MVSSEKQTGSGEAHQTDGLACPRVGCDYFGIIEEVIHALVGYGFTDGAKTICKLRCRACRQTFSSYKRTPLYYLKSDPDEVAMVLWFLAEGLDQAVLTRYTGGRKRRLPVGSGWMPLFLSDGLRAYFYAISAHFGRWSRSPRARTDHWKVDGGLLSSAEYAVSRSNAIDGGNWSTLLRATRAMGNKRPTWCN